jgi:hypothetical protein
MKQLIILFAGVILLGTTACRKVTENYYTTPNKTIYVERIASQWTSSDAGKTYSTVIPFEDSDGFYHEYDGILVYASFDNGNIYEQIPQTYQGISYSYSTTINDAVVDLQSANFDVTVTPPNKVLFKIVLIPSEE